MEYNVKRKNILLPLEKVRHYWIVMRQVYKEAQHPQVHVRFPAVTCLSNTDEILVSDVPPPSPIPITTSSSISLVYPPSFRLGSSLVLKNLKAPRLLQSPKLPTSLLFPPYLTFPTLVSRALPSPVCDSCGKQSNQHILPLSHPSLYPPRFLPPRISLPLLCSHLFWYLPMSTLYIYYASCIMLRVLS